MNCSDITNSSTGTVDESTRRATLAIYVLTFIFGSTGNLLVLLVVAKKHSRSINDVFIMHLAFSDLSFIILCLPVFIYMQVSSFQGSLVYCKIIWPMMTISFCAGIFTVTLMAVHRCKSILRPFENSLKKRQLVVCFLVTWLLSFLVALPMIIVAKVGPSGSCCEDWPTVDHKRVYTAVLAGLQYFVPLIIISTAYPNWRRIVFVQASQIFHISGKNTRGSKKTRKQKNCQNSCHDSCIFRSLHVSNPCCLDAHRFWREKRKKDSACCFQIFRFVSGVSQLFEPSYLWNSDTSVSR